MATMPPYGSGGPPGDPYGGAAAAWPDLVQLDPVDGADPVNPLAAQLLPESVCRHFRIVPISYAGGELTLAVSDPNDTLAQSVAHSLTNDPLRIVAAAPEEIDGAIDRAFGGAPPPPEMGVEPRARRLRERRALHAPDPGPARRDPGLPRPDHRGRALRGARAAGAHRLAASARCSTTSGWSARTTSPPALADQLRVPLRRPRRRSSPTRRRSR